MATIRDKSIGPNVGLWTYTISEKLGSVTASDYRELLRSIRQRCQSNGVEAPEESEIEQTLCDNLPIRCIDENRKLYPNLYADRRNWPLSLRPMRLLAQTGDKGLGDIVERTIPKGDAFKLWFKATFGFSCGCDERKNWLNLNYPL